MHECNNNSNVYLGQMASGKQVDVIQFDLECYEERENEVK